MSDPVLFLSRPAGERLATIHDAPPRTYATSPWTLLLTAVLMAGAALACAGVVILGAPGGDPAPAKGDPVHMAIGAR